MPLRHRCDHQRGWCCCEWLYVPCLTSTINRHGPYDTVHMISLGTHRVAPTDVLKLLDHSNSDMYGAMPTISECLSSMLTQSSSVHDVVRPVAFAAQSLAAAVADAAGLPRSVWPPSVRPRFCCNFCWSSTHSVISIEVSSRFRLEAPSSEVTASCAGVLPDRAASGRAATASDCALDIASSASVGAA